VVSATQAAPWSHLLWPPDYRPGLCGKSRKFAGGLGLSARTGIHHRRRNAGAERLGIRIKVTDCPKARGVGHQISAPMPPCSMRSIWTIQPHPEFTQIFIDGADPPRGQGRVVPDTSLNLPSALAWAAPTWTTRKSPTTLPTSSRK